MSFYTIDGRFVNKKNVVEGFFDNRVIEHATIGIDYEEETEGETVEETTEGETTEGETAEETTEGETVGEDTIEQPDDETTMEAPIEGAVDETAEVPMTDEMKEDKSMYMNFCINDKCLTGSELRKLNELYDKKCTN